MMTLELHRQVSTARVELKGPRGGEWLSAQGLTLPPAANTWSDSNSVLVARLGTTEFFLEGDAGSGADAQGPTVERISAALAEGPAGVYPVLREDWAFVLHGGAVHDALAQVCNVNFAEIPLASHSVIMTLMVGVSVVVIPSDFESERGYRIWCDPTFGPYLGETLGAVVKECGGTYGGHNTGATA